MAGHVQGRGQAYSHPQSQPPQQRQKSESKAPTQATQTQPDSPKPKLRTSCDGCQEAKLGCSQEKPTCRRCLRHGITCVYSPFRRIGRPRKSTNSRSVNGANATKSRSKNDDAPELVNVTPIESLPELKTDIQFGSSMFFDPVPAPPSSPASTENGGGSWYPWTPDGNSLYNGLHINLDSSASLIDGTDPFSNTPDYLDLDACFDAHHNMLMDCGMPKGDTPMLDLEPSMQPTPPSSTTAEMMVFGERMPENSDSIGMDTLLSQHTQCDQPGLNGSPASASNRNVPGLKIGTTFADYANQNVSGDNGIAIHPSSHLSTGVRSNGQSFAPSPELTPPLTAQSPPSQNPCNKRCSSSLIQQLASLNQHLSDSSNPPLETVLQVEKDAHSLCRKIISCNPCIGNRSSYLLFSMVVEQVMRLLETIPDEGASESCSLLIGKFEIDHDTKASFLKRYLLTRLSKFALMLKEFAQIVDDDDSEDYNSNAAKKMVRDVYQRLDLLRGIVDMWE